MIGALKRIGGAVAMAALGSLASAQTYQTYGVHNDPKASPCQSADCRYPRAPGTPADPVYPTYWSAKWTMYRVFNHYQTYGPPYRGRPPMPLRPGIDYEISYGATYYDSTWRGRSGAGAMMEHYDRRCLPIFPISNHFTCSFISLGDTAFFVTYPQDRPQGMPPVCLFSPVNHPPRRDFIAHLPYSAGDSARIGAHGQGYSFWIAADGGKVVQTGASPDRTADQAILFGYGFQADARGKQVPQSFYFSGYPLAPANAPIVSQNYTSFAAVRPDPAKTWRLVSGLDPATLPACHLFAPASGVKALAPGKTAPTWGDIGTWRKR
ncbi:hypothetical protein [Sphingomonas psychrolutea]|uniref:Uncharacterized protein n=1 Tax=Sphingomonas psychrolutea TaxID=1259676 RepID=A0ABQ1GHX0_9SPHN|nr:hypothetical protein [Sphingomonas psychrolutea]GGA44053.1 hypothetical protein GCM10011395_12820 [Sphingomonas psychrolutea]